MTDFVGYVRAQIAYNEWADGKILEAAAGLSDDELREERPSAYGSLANTLAHIVNTERGWLSVLTGNPQLYREAPPQTGIVEGLREWYAEAHEGLRRYAESLTGEQLAGEIVARNPASGQEYRWPAWHLVQHLMAHGVQHRGEAGIALLALGRSPGDIDYLDFEEARARP